MKIVYWSGTGNTESMANAIAEGIKAAGKEADVINVGEVNIDEILKEDVLILGCPAMGDEVLEEGEFDPFIEEISGKVSGKKAVLFGSYGWGDGQWMRDWEDRMLGYGCEIPLECLINNNEADEAQCREFGEKIARL